MFKVSVATSELQIADTLHKNNGQAQAHVNKHTKKKPFMDDGVKVMRAAWPADAVATISDVTAEEAARDAANQAVLDRREAALDALALVDTSTITDPILKSVVELLQ